MNLFPALGFLRDRIRRSGTCLCLAALAVSSTLLAGCAREPVPVQWELGREGETMYYFLVQLEAAVSGDVDTFTQAGERLLELEPGEAAYLDLAEFSLRRGRLDEARIIARKGLATFPASLPLVLIISDSYLQQERGDEAGATLLDYLKDYPDNADALQELARVYLVGEKYPAFDELLKTVPKSRMTPYLHYVRARSLLNRNRLAEGEKELRYVVRHAPDMIDAWVNLGITLQLGGRHAEAIPMFRKAVALDGENAGLWLRLVDAQLKAKRYTQAVAVANEAPSSPGFLIETAMLFVEANRHATARTFLRQARDMPGAPEEVHLYLAALAMENLRNPSEALAELAAISPKSPLAERALRWRLQILEDSGKLADGVAVARDFAQQNPLSPEFQVIYARAADLTGDSQTAIAVLREARHKWPEDTAVALLLASCLENADRRDEAMALMEFVLEREPRNAMALNYIGYTLADEGRDLERAHDLILRARQESPEDPHIADSLAWVLFRMGRYDEAWKAISTSIALGGDHPVIWDHYGDIALKTGDRTEAKKGWTNALKLDPDDPDAIKAKLAELP